MKYYSAIQKQNKTEMSFATTCKDLEGDFFSFICHDCHRAHLDHHPSPLTTILGHIYCVNIFLNSGTQR